MRERSLRSKQREDLPRNEKQQDRQEDENQQIPHTRSYCGQPRRMVELAEINGHTRILLGDVHKRTECP